MVMDDDLFKEDDDDIHKVGVQNMNSRLIMIQALVIIVPDFQLMLYIYLSALILWFMKCM